MIKKLVSHLGAYKAASIKTPLFAALEAIMDVLHGHPHLQVLSAPARQK